jgi:hypothetical protein
MGNHDKTPTNATKLPDVMAPADMFSMQAKLNSKDFLKLDTLKCAVKSDLMAWYRDICVHGSMWGVFIPPSLSLQSDYPMGSLWDKWYLGATVHASRGKMGRILAKLLLTPLMFPKDQFGNVIKIQCLTGKVMGMQH